MLAEKIRFLVSGDSSAEGAVHQIRQYRAREQKCPYK